MSRLEPNIEQKHSEASYVRHVAARTWDPAGVHPIA